MRTPEEMGRDMLADAEREGRRARRGGWGDNPALHHSIRMMEACIGGTTVTVAQVHAAFRRGHAAEGDGKR